MTIKMELPDGTKVTLDESLISDELYDTIKGKTVPENIYNQQLKVKELETELARLIALPDEITIVNEEKSKIYFVEEQLELEKGILNNFE